MPDWLDGFDVSQSGRGWRGARPGMERLRFGYVALHFLKYFAASPKIARGHCFHRETKIAESDARNSSEELLLGPLRRSGDPSNGRASILAWLRVFEDQPDQPDKHVFQA